MRILRISSCLCLVAAARFAGTEARASVMAVDPAAFVKSPVVDFTGLASGTEVNGLTVNGILFHYLLGSTSTNGQVNIAGGPGITNNIAPPDIVSIGNNTGTLTLTLPRPITAIGYGYAILNKGSLANATTISLFNDGTPLGSLSYAGVPDPTFTGGFAGIASTVAFDRVAITLVSAEPSAFAVDNFVLANSVPEPSTILLSVLGVGFLLYCCLRPRKWVHQER